MHSCRSWASRTSGCGRGRSSDVSLVFISLTWDKQLSRHQLVFNRSARLAKSGVLPRCVRSPWIHGADGPLSIGRGGAGARFWDVHHRQRVQYPPRSREHHQQPQHHSEKVVPVQVCEVSVVIHIKHCLIFLLLLLIVQVSEWWERVPLRRQPPPLRSFYPTA